MNKQDLLSAVKLGPYTLPNRVVMAPMTRSRAYNRDRTPTELHAEYYAQRASAGLIITEGSQISPQAVGYVYTPGIHSQAQIRGWKKSPMRCTPATDTFSFSSGTWVMCRIRIFTMDNCQWRHRPSTPIPNPSPRWV